MRRTLIRGFHFTGALLLLILLLPSCATTNLHSTPAVQSYQGLQTHEQKPQDSDRPDLSVMTLNVAHGRGTGFHQMLQYSDETRKNLDNVATLLNDNAPDIVALQEVDSPSFWSGNFNHVEYLASRSVFTHSVQASHVDGMGLSYGTALMSRLDLSNPQAVTFDPSLSPVPKGFVVSTISWPGREGVDIDVISVHLDFMSGSIRNKQADELIAVLRARNNRMIIMGDLNTEWHQQDSAAQYLVEKLGLTAFQPENRELVTFPAFKERLDWILISSGLEFHSHKVIGTGVSDHRGVIAKISLSSR
jgi:endonuclease/exonuclease/phosphatase family metal-dependent hydrolase